MLAITDPTTTVLLSALAPFLGRDGRARRVHVVSGSFGAGHDAAAHELSWRLSAAGHRVERWDVVSLFPGGLGRLVRFAYLRQLAVAPRSWGCCSAGSARATDRPPAWRGGRCRRLGTTSLGSRPAGPTCCVDHLFASQVPATCGSWARSPHRSSPT